MVSQDKILEDVKETKETALYYVSAWGKSPLPPTILATLIASLHLRPFRVLPILFTPIFLFSTYLNLSSFVIDSAGITTAFSGLYILLAQRMKSKRRKVGIKGIASPLSNRFGARPLVRSAATGLAGMNLVACGLTYAIGRRKEEDNAL